MPEGHTIHRLARELRRAFAGNPVRASSPQGRFADGAAMIDGSTLVAAHAHGKHLVVEFETELLHVHLGLIGKFRPALGEPPRDTIRLRLERLDAVFDLTGPQDCRLIDPAEYAAITDRLGPDPLRRGARRTDFVDALTRRRAPVAAVLLDQAVIAGIGNVYRAELLFLLGIDPRRPANLVDKQSADELWNLTVKQLRLGVRLDRIVTVSEADSGRSPGRLAREDALYVYKRQDLPCRRCGTPISVGEVGGRSCWWCSSCQV